MSATKIMFSPAEQGIVSDSQFFLTKKIITDKVYDLFGRQQVIIKNIWEERAVKEDINLLDCNAKITRGEQYEGLPYIILDYPAVFDKENIFALRTMFWWGNNFSIHLLCAGKFMESFGPAIETMLKRDASDIYLCVNKTPWAHHFRETNYVMPVLQSNSLSSEFLKVGFQFSLEDPNVEQKLKQTYSKIISTLLS